MDCIELRRCIFEDFSSQDGAGAGSSGGAIWVDLSGSYFLIQDSFVFRCSCPGDGGAMWVATGTSYALIVRVCTRDCSAGNSGAFCCWQSGSRADFNTSRVAQSPRADCDGSGTIFIEGSSPVFCSGFNVSGASSCGSGALICLPSASRLRATDSTVSGCRGSDVCVAFEEAFAWERVNVLNSEFTNYVLYCAASVPEPSSLTDCWFLGNTAPADFGSAGPFSLINCVLSREPIGTLTDDSSFTITQALIPHVDVLCFTWFFDPSAEHTASSEFTISAPLATDLPTEFFSSSRLVYLQKRRFVQTALFLTFFS
jgi:hypothetical protein